MVMQTHYQGKTEGVPDDRPTLPVKQALTTDAFPP